MSASSTKTISNRPLSQEFINEYGFDKYGHLLWFYYNQPELTKAILDSIVDNLNEDTLEKSLRIFDNFQENKNTGELPNQQLENFITATRKLELTSNQLRQVIKIQQHAMAHTDWRPTIRLSETEAADLPLIEEVLASPEKLNWAAYTSDQLSTLLLTVADQVNEQNANESLKVFSEAVNQKADKAILSLYFDLIRANLHNQKILKNYRPLLLELLIGTHY